MSKVFGKKDIKIGRNKWKEQILFYYLIFVLYIDRKKEVKTGFRFKFEQCFSRRPVKLKGLLYLIV